MKETFLESVDGHCVSTVMQMHSWGYTEIPRDDQNLQKYVPRTPILGDSFMRTEQEALEEACEHHVDIEADKLLRRYLLIVVLPLLGVAVVGLVWYCLS